jgi:hypothetical protein
MNAASEQGENVISFPNGQLRPNLTVKDEEAGTR